jgi:hypothetical protein
MKSSLKKSLIPCFLRDPLHDSGDLRLHVVEENLLVGAYNRSDRHTVRQDLERVNGYLPEPSRVQKFVLLHKEFDPDEAELTRTRKLRREFMEQRIFHGNILPADIAQASP